MVPFLRYKIWVHVWDQITYTYTSMLITCITQSPNKNALCNTSSGVICQTACKMVQCLTVNLLQMQMTNIFWEQNYVNNLPSTMLMPLVVDFEDMTSQQLRLIIWKQKWEWLHASSIMYNYMLFVDTFYILFTSFQHNVYNIC